MPDPAADPTMTDETLDPGGHEKPADTTERQTDPLVKCPACGAEAVPRDSSHGVNEPSRGPACPNCGASLEPEA